MNLIRSGTLVHKPKADNYLYMHISLSFYSNANSFCYDLGWWIQDAPEPIRTHIAACMGLKHLLSNITAVMLYLVHVDITSLI